jgi:spore germination protein YaaH
MRTALAVLIGFTLLAAPAMAAPPERPEPTAPGPEPLGHKHLIDEHRSLPPSYFGGVTPGVLPSSRHLLDQHTRPIVTRDVLGYLPYWSYSANAPYVPLRWDLLTILAWFGAEMGGSGNITARHGWGGATTARIVQDAHAHGVIVIITITNFSGTEIASIVNNAANRARAIDNCLSLMAEHGADGINIDFEFVPRSARDGFVTFMTELTAAVRAVRPNGGPGHVSLAGPAVDWNGAYDYDVLLENTDGIMVMAYGYHWTRSSNAGPTSPLHEGDLWNTRSVAWTIDDYLRYGGVENRGRVIIGLPWYGRSWQVASQTVPAPALSDGATRTFKVAEPEALSLGKLWEAVSKSTYYHKSSGGVLSQIWYDDGRSFHERVAYVDEMDLGGVGIWALGYEGAYPDLWDAIDAVLAPEVVPDPEPGPEPVEHAEPPVEPAEPAEPPAEVVETAPEVGPEPVAESGPEPSPEPAAEVSVAEDPVTPGGPVTTPIDPRRSISAKMVGDGGGCQGGAATSLVMLALFALARQRGRGRGLLSGGPIQA